jgi:polysaccharide biosynthesis protein PslH
MNLTIIAHDIPYPPTHGGRVDMWRRIQAFLDCGINIQICCWAYPEDKAEIKDERLSDCLVIPLGRSFPFRLSKLPYILRYPYAMAIRSVNGDQFKSILTRVRRFNPDAVWLDGLSGFLLAEALATDLHKPLVYRSHNIEHLYTAGLRKVATTMRGKIALSMSGYNLKKYEYAAIRKAALVYDISCDDIEYWKENGIDNIYWLPPFACQDWVRCAYNHEKVEYDILYLGNLHLYNNVAGIKWFVEKILPIIKEKRPNIRLLIAGNNPSQEIRKLCTDNKIDLLSNPPDAFEVFSSARILINPAITGSGVSIKTLDMLSTKKPVVSTPIGVIGLSDEIKALVHVAHDEQGFAEQVLNSMAAGNRVAAHVDMERLLGYNQLDSIVSQLSRLINTVTAQEPLDRTP